MRLHGLQKRVESISIYRPLKAHRILKALRQDRVTLRAESKRIVDGLVRVVLITPDKNMGQTLTSCLDILRIAAEMTRLQSASAELEGFIQQTGAFAFAIFALDVALVSLLATVVLGVLSLVA